MLKEYFVKEITHNKEDECNEDVFIAKKENDNMFLTTVNFIFLDVKNFIEPSLNYDAWCKSMGSKLQNFLFPDECLGSYKKLSHVGQVRYDDFYSSLKPTITKDE